MLCSVSKAVCFERWRQYGRLCCLSKSQLLRSTSQLNCKLELAGHKPLHLRSSVTACKMTSWSDPTSLGFLLFYVAFARKFSYITSLITHQSPSWARGQVINKYSLSPPPPPPSTWCHPFTFITQIFSFITIFTVYSSKVNTQNLAQAPQFWATSFLPWDYSFQVVGKDQQQHGNTEAIKKTKLISPFIRKTSTYSHMFIQLVNCHIRDILLLF